MIKQDILEKQAKYSYLAIGSNLGDKYGNIEFAKNMLNHYKIYVKEVSSYYETPSWPEINFPKYFNVVVKVKSRLSLVDLFKTIKKIENFIGKRTGLRNHPRKCDIDIIDFQGLHENVELLEHKIEVPHPRMHTRNFVIFPLYELNKTWIHPKTKVKINSLISHFNNKDFSDIRIV